MGLAVVRGEDIHEVKRRRHTVRYLESCREILELQLQAVDASINLERMMRKEGGHLAAGTS